MLKRLFSTQPVNSTLTYVVGVKPPNFLVPTSDNLNKDSDLTSVPLGLPKEYQEITVIVRKNHPSKMKDTGQQKAEQTWRLDFPRKPNWRNQLMGWVATRDAFSGACGPRGMAFPSAENALAFATKMGWQASYESYEPKPKTQGENIYQNNFLQLEVVEALKKVPPARATKTIFAHPERGRSSWVNLGAVAVKEGTSTQNHTADVKQVSQAFWKSKEYDDKHKASWRYDTPEKQYWLSTRKSRG